MMDAHNLQDFLWDNESWDKFPFSARNWGAVFQKRVDAITQIDMNNPSWKVELRKRLLQQASLSLKAILALNNSYDRTTAS
jgi:hypothetical protein